MPTNDGQLIEYQSLMQKSIEEYKPSDYSYYAAQWKRRFFEVFGKTTDKYINTLLNIGATHIDFNNCEMAEYYLDEAVSQIVNLYGKECFLAQYVRRFYALIAYLRGDYVNCIENAATSLVATHKMQLESIALEFRDIFEKKEEHVENIFILLYRASIELKNTSGEDNSSICDMVNPDGSVQVASALLEEMKKLDIPPDIYEIMELRLLKCEQSLNNENKRLLENAFRIMCDAEMFWDDKNTDDFENDVRHFWIQKFTNAYISIINVFGEDSIIGKMVKNSIANLIFTFLPGYIKLGYPQKTIEYYELNKDTPMNAKGSIMLMVWKCLAYDQLNDYENTRLNLQHILDIFKDIISQIIFLFDEEKQLDFLKIFQEVMQTCVYLLRKYNGNHIAYNFYLNNKMLAYDYSSISKRYFCENDKYRKIMQLRDVKANCIDKHEIRRLQTELLEETNVFDLYKDLFSVPIGSICDNIVADYVLIEYAYVYKEIGKSEFEAETSVVAFVLNNSGLLDCITLDDGMLIDKQINDFTNIIVENKTDTVLEKTEAYNYLLKSIIQPVLLICPANLRGIIIAPAGSLFGLSFELFIADNLKIRYIDSGRELARNNQFNNQVKIVGECIAIGAPNYIDHVDLPTSFYEVSVIAKMFNSSPVTNLQVNKNIFDRTFKFLHISSHGDYRPTDDYLSGSYLILSDDEKISAKEISQKDFLGTELVTLSACKSGLGIKTNFDGMIGLRRSFLNAGVKNIIVSLWRVKEVATSILMVEFYKNISKNKMNPYESLFRAKNYLKNLTTSQTVTIFDDMAEYLSEDIVLQLKKSLEDLDETDKPFSKPYYWASFILVES